MRGASAEQVIRAIRGMPVFVHKDCRATNGMADAIRVNGLRMARMVEAEVFVVTTPGRANHDITFISALRGSYHISPELLVSGRGIAIKMKGVSHLPKVLFHSPAFAAKHPEAVDFTRRVIANIPGCRWGVASEGWNDLKSRVAKAALFALVCQSELGGGTFNGHKNTFTIGMLNKRITTVDLPNSIMGLA